MFRIFLVVMVVLGLAGCSSAPTKAPNPFVPYSLQDPAKSSFTGKKLYKLGTVKVALDQMRVNERFPDSQGLEQIFAAMLTDKLESAGYLAAADQDGIGLDVDIKYKRIYFGEAFGLSKGFASSTFSYTSDLTCERNICASYHSPEYVANKGLAGNLLKIGKQLSMTGSPEDELSEIAIYVNEIMENIPR